jgi:hypothetical protein
VEGIEEPGLLQARGLCARLDGKQPIVVGLVEHLGWSLDAREVN